MKYGVKTDKGKIRELNEDGYLATGLVFAVADGMGGHKGGEIASQIALEAIEKTFNKIPTDNLENYLKEAIEKVNTFVYEKSAENPELSGMGTTLTLAVPLRDKLYLAHVGDSRAYLFRQDKLTQLTEDHSLVNKWVKEGKLKKEEAENHPMRNVITRALGAEPQVRVDLKTIELKEGDRILLTTDGLHMALSSDMIASFLKKYQNPQKTCEELVKTANTKSGEDNITAVLLDI